MIRFRKLKRIGLYGMPAFSGKCDLMVSAYDHESPRFVASGWLHAREVLKIYSIKKRPVPELIEIGALIRSGRPEKSPLPADPTGNA